MTGSALTARLGEIGLDPDETVRKQPLADAIAEAFETLSEAPPTWAWWVPGRLEVFGKHTDYCGGHSLLATIPKGFIVAARARDGDAIRLIDARRGDRFELQSRPDAGEIDEPPISGWRRYARTVVARLGRNFPGAQLGADIVFGSDLPSASGMSSSSALVVGLVNALVETAGLRGRMEWQSNVRTAADAAGYYACFENGAPFGTLAGDEGVGTHGGSEDHVAIVLGARDTLSAWRFVPIRHVADAAFPAGWSCVIASSGVAAQKIGPAKERYNSLSDRARRLLDLWNAAHLRAPSLSAALAAGPSAVAELQSILAHAGDGAVLRDRLEHFVREDRRILEAREAVLGADRGRIGELSDASQRDAESLLGNQVAETVALARSARELGAFAASSFGAGFGGSVWAMVDRKDADTFAGRWLSDYQARFPERTAATTFIARPGPPLARLV